METITFETRSNGDGIFGDFQGLPTWLMIQSDSVYISNGWLLDVTGKIGWFVAKILV